MDRTKIINLIDEYSALTGLKQTTICQYALANRKFYQRLQGGYFHETHAQRLVEWMEANPATERAAQ
jgi:hypothetical protein